MNRLPLTVLAAAATAAPLAAADVQVTSAGPLVEISVTETVKAKPDIATVSTGVTSLAPTAVAAMQKNANAMDAVVQRIKALGIAPDDIQTAGVDLNAQYDYDNASRRQIFRGYQATNRVSVILRKIPDTGRVLDALVAAGATDISGPAFSIDNDAGPRSQARKAAFDKSRSQAEEYARWAGYSGVRVLRVSEDIAGRNPMPYDRAAMPVAAQAAKSTPIEPGLVGTAVTVTVTYEMTR